MTAFVLELVLGIRKSHRAPVIAMTVVIAAALVPATTLLGRVPSEALPSTPQELVNVPAPATDRAVIPQSLGYFEFDWSAAQGGVPGSDYCPTTRTSACAQTEHFQKQNGSNQ